ncbi:hypothetical protein R3P38DRAFT_3450561 [Favolaschia claudopus]|uniref:C3H1-type domain-containing protein n=1 Tax=Favolaschia claudopus TaxID=2862362 RepID=A0AAV9ZLL2_9AGAR
MQHANTNGFSDTHEANDNDINSSEIESSMPPRNGYPSSSTSSASTLPGTSPCGDVSKGQAVFCQTPEYRDKVGWGGVRVGVGRGTCVYGMRLFVVVKRRRENLTSSGRRHTDAVTDKDATQSQMIKLQFEMEKNDRPTRGDRSSSLSKHRSLCTTTLTLTYTSGVQVWNATHLGGVSEVVNLNIPLSPSYQHPRSCLVFFRGYAVFCGHAEGGGGGDRQRRDSMKGTREAGGEGREGDGGERDGEMYGPVSSAAIMPPLRGGKLGSGGDGDVGVLTPHALYVYALHAGRVSARLGFPLALAASGGKRERGSGRRGQEYGYGASREDAVVSGVRCAFEEEVIVVTTHSPPALIVLARPSLRVVHVFPVAEPTVPARPLLTAGLLMHPHLLLITTPPPTHRSPQSPSAHSQPPPRIPLPVALAPPSLGYASPPFASPNPGGSGSSIGDSMASLRRSMTVLFAECAGGDERVCGFGGRCGMGKECASRHAFIPPVWAPLGGLRFTADGTKLIGPTPSPLRFWHPLPDVSAPTPVYALKRGQRVRGGRRACRARDEDCACVCGESIWRARKCDELCCGEGEDVGVPLLGDVGTSVTGEGCPIEVHALMRMRLPPAPQAVAGESVPLLPAPIAFIPLSAEAEASNACGRLRCRGHRVVIAVVAVVGEKHVALTIVLMLDLSDGVLSLRRVPVGVEDFDEEELVPGESKVTRMV